MEGSHFDGFPEKSHMTLCEAVTWLALGRATAKEVLWKDVLYYDAKYSGFPSVVIEYLREAVYHGQEAAKKYDERFRLKHKGLDSVFEIPKKVTGLKKRLSLKSDKELLEQMEADFRKEQENQIKLNEAASFLLELARNETITLWGQEAPHVGRIKKTDQATKVPVGYLLNPNMQAKLDEDSIWYVRKDDFEPKWERSRYVNIQISRRGVEDAMLRKQSYEEEHPTKYIGTGDAIEWIAFRRYKQPNYFIPHIKYSDSIPISKRLCFALREYMRFKTKGKAWPLEEEWYVGVRKYFNLRDEEQTPDNAHYQMNRLGLSEWEFRKKLVLNARDFFHDERKRDMAALELAAKMDSGAIKAWGRPWYKGKHFYDERHQEIPEEYFMGGEPEVVRNDHLRIKGRPNLEEWYELRVERKEVERIWPDKMD